MVDLSRSHHHTHFLSLSLTLSQNLAGRRRLCNIMKFFVFVCPSIHDVSFSSNLCLSLSLTHTLSLSLSLLSHSLTHNISLSFFLSFFLSFDVVPRMQRSSFKSGKTWSSLVKRSYYLLAKLPPSRLFS